MADSQIDSRVMLKRNSQILVNVDEAQQDILLVSYAFESKLFQGVLLDSTKRFLPCRIPEVPVNPIGSPKNEDKISEEDKLFYNIRQRFTYFQEKPAHIGTFHQPKKVTKATKTQKMTVRLRPRQVLCSKCKSICNENSENVNSLQNKNKKPEPPDSSPRPLFSENRRDNQLPNHSPPTKLCPSFVQRIPRLPTSPIQNNSLNGNVPTARSMSEEFWFMSDEQKETYSQLDDEADKQMVLRKKRSVGSMEDLWDETVFEEGSKKAKTTPVIKISFGSQGEGTVLKIPSKVQICSESETEDKLNTPSVSKATRKALKKAKKEARKKILSTDSPKRHKSPSPPELPYKKHKHKLKHKKKHKTDKTEEEIIKDKGLKQKLSINLRRLTSTTYEKAESSDSSASSEDISEYTDPKVPDVVEDSGSACTAGDGSALTPGDIVWGKVHGFPWWPGKVSDVSYKREEECWEANVTWYGSATSTLIPCHQLEPFLATFKAKYNRRKRSAGYKEAIRLATTEASASNPDITPEALLSEALKLREDAREALAGAVDSRKEIGSHKSHLYPTKKKRKDVEEKHKISCFF